MARKRSSKPIDKSTVAAYRHFEELKDCLASNWSCASVREYMINRYGAEGVPHLRAIQKWQAKHMTVEGRILPHDIIQKKLKGVQFKVDVIAHLSRLIALCEDRVARGIAQEDQFAGMPLAVNDGVMQTYLHALAQYVQVAQDLGIMKAPVPSTFLVDARTQNLIVTPETLLALRETVKEIKRIEQGGRDARLGRAEVSNQEDDQKADVV